MPELTVRDVLERLAASPAATFRVADIASDHLEHLRPFAVFKPDPQPGEQVACPTANGLGCMRVLDAIGGELIAVCTCEAAEVPVPVELGTFASFTVDTARLAQSLARADDLAGSPARLTERCHYLGQMEISGHRVGVVLGLFDDRDAARELRALPGSLSDAVDQVVCLTPSYQPLPEAELALAAIDVRVLQLDGLDVRESLARRLAPPSRTVPLVVLSPEEERDFAAAGLRCRWPIVVTGETGKGGTNVVEVAGKTVTLGPAMFPLFMRLLTALFETDNGFLPVKQPRRGKGLAGEGYYRFDRAHETHGHLRTALGEFRDLVEVGGGMIRLSTHRKFVRIDCEALSQHRNLKVRDLARRIRTVAT